jgi:hypothetical protein
MLPVTGSTETVVAVSPELMYAVFVDAIRMAQGDC